MNFLFVSTYGKGDYTNGGGLLLLFMYAVLAVVLITIVAVIAGIFEYYEIHALKFYKYFSDLSGERKKILKEQFSYYQKLSSKDQKLFEDRVHHFLINKNFFSKDLEVTEEMKVLIAATAMQILFGLDAYYLSGFHSIELTTEDLKDTVSEKSKRVIICWPEFKSGIENASDGYNPGLKILSVAFNFEYQLNKYSARMFNKHRFKELNQLYRIQAEKYILSGKSGYQDYKQIDRNEYFAVAVEYFFERPEHFYSNESEMYLALAKLLRQDTLGIYTFKRK
jgi:Mlc titration factor MtfA (ptsG expression regulator)